MDNSKIRAISKDQMKGNWGTAIILTLIVSVILGVVNSLFPSSIDVDPNNPMTGNMSHYIQDGIESGTMIRYGFNGLLNSLVGTLFNTSILYGFLELVDRGRLKIDAITYAFDRNFLKLLGVIILKSVFMFIGFILFIIPGIIINYMLSQSELLLKDGVTTGVVESLRESKDRMKGYKMQLFTLHLPYFIMIIALPLVMVFLGVQLFMGGNSANILSFLALFAVLAILFLVITFYVNAKINSLSAIFYRNVIHPMERNDDGITIDDGFPTFEVDETDSFDQNAY